MNNLVKSNKIKDLSSIENLKTVLQYQNLNLKLDLNNILYFLDKHGLSILLKSYNNIMPLNNYTSWIVDKNDIINNFIVYLMNLLEFWKRVEIILLGDEEYYIGIMDHLKVLLAIFTLQFKNLGILLQKKPNAIRYNDIVWSEIVKNLCFNYTNSANNFFLSPYDYFFHYTECLTNFNNITFLKYFQYKNLLNFPGYLRQIILEIQQNYTFTNEI